MTGVSSTPTARRAGVGSDELRGPVSASVEGLDDPPEETLFPPVEPDVEVIKIEGTHGR
jgi:hypothetical protein